MGIRASSSDSACAQDTSPTLPEGITSVHLKWSIFKSLLEFILSLSYQSANLCWLWKNIYLVFFPILHRSVGKVFCTMDGNGSMVHIHPSSSVNEFLNSLKKNSWLLKAVVIEDMLKRASFFFTIPCPCPPAVWQGGWVELGHLPRCPGDLTGVCQDCVSYSLRVGEGLVT